MNLVFAKPISRFLLVKALQFTIPLRHSISKIPRDIQVAELETLNQETIISNNHYKILVSPYIRSFNCQAVMTGMDCFFVSSLYTSLHWCARSLSLCTIIGT
jgi:hypothetical protein